MCLKQTSVHGSAPFDREEKVNTKCAYKHRAHTNIVTILMNELVPYDSAWPFRHREVRAPCTSGLGHSGKQTQNFTSCSRRLSLGRFLYLLPHPLLYGQPPPPMVATCSRLRWKASNSGPKLEGVTLSLAVPDEHRETGGLPFPMQGSSVSASHPRGCPQ